MVRRHCSRDCSGGVVFASNSQLGQAHPAAHLGNRLQLQSPKHESNKNAERFDTSTQRERVSERVPFS
jgi:hypothetical protein